MPPTGLHVYRENLSTKTATVLFPILLHRYGSHDTQHSAREWTLYKNLRRIVKDLQLKQLWFPIPIERCEVAGLEFSVNAAGCVSTSCNYCQHFVGRKISLRRPPVGFCIVSMDWLRIMVPFGETYYISTNPYHSITLCHERPFCSPDWL